MTDIQRENILNRFSRLYLQSTNLEDRIDFERLAGNIDKVMELDAEDDMLIARMNGMQEALELLGYKLYFSPLKCDVVIERM